MSGVKVEKKGDSLLICPFCGLPLTARIKRQWFIKMILFRKPVKRYACGSCRHKFYIIKEKF
ncbi:hypothetical protein DDR33_19820 [Pararcticibacter amylolyticus]|uniref:Uncharacterized protein n=1 Tax=Pararcticibacter amylolyticus TaxID=2173175 RepID=A0A2U2PC82_9SPHI|nr:hypothetical protein DDR33_19820 [Pararcticibacter amylolyticus]